MPTTSILLILLVAALLVLIAALVYPPTRTSNNALLTPSARHIRIDRSVWPFGWPHEAPDHAVTVPQARRIMQQHRDCDQRTCRRKAAAYAILVAAHEILTPEDE